MAGGPHPLILRLHAIEQHDYYESILQTLKPPVANLSYRLGVGVHTLSDRDECSAPGLLN